LSDHLPYRQERTIETELGGQDLRLVTRPGFPHWAQVTQAMQLIADNVRLGSDESVLVWPCGHGALAAWAARHTREDRVLALDTNAVAVDAAARTVAANGCAGVRTRPALPGEVAAAHDVALMTLPKGRDLARLCFLEALHALRPGGSLYLAGANQEGIKSAIKDAAELYGEAVVLNYKGGNRVARCDRPETLAEQLPERYRVPGVAPGTWHAFSVHVGDQTYQIRSRPGVFSWRSLDAGTRMLLRVLEVHDDERVVDVGCGYGIIGLYAARRATRGRVTLVDVDLLACRSAEATLAANDIHATVVHGDGLAAARDGAPYTLVVSNPPFHSGHDVSYRVTESFVREARELLAPDGRLVLVANRFLPYGALLAEHYASVETLAETSRYYVLSASRRQRAR
jgi:16S rRNA (guanine1207-N2)-methyltransferase